MRLLGQGAEQVGWLWIGFHFTKLVFKGDYRRVDLSGNGVAFEVRGS
jgi:hypothetical protein